MDDSVRSMMLASVHLSTLRWTNKNLRRLREYATRLDFPVEGARLRADMTEGRLIGLRDGLTFWYYPEAKGRGALYLVQQCPVCRRPFPTEVQTAAEVAAFWDQPLPECRPARWTWAYLRHQLHARRAERHKP